MGVFQNLANLGGGFFWAKIKATRAEQYNGLHAKKNSDSSIFELATPR